MQVEFVFDGSVCLLHVHVEEQQCWFMYFANDSDLPGLRCLCYLKTDEYLWMLSDGLYADFKVIQQRC